MTIEDIIIYLKQLDYFFENPGKPYTPLNLNNYDQNQLSFIIDQIINDNLKIKEL